MKNAMQYVRAMASGSCFGTIREYPSARLARIAMNIAITIAMNNDLGDGFGDDLAMIWAMGGWQWQWQWQCSWQWFGQCGRGGRVASRSREACQISPARHRPYKISMRNQ